MKPYKIFSSLSLIAFSIAFAFITFAQTTQKDVLFTLISDATSPKVGDTIEVTLSMENPSKRNVSSFEAWLSYDSTVLKGVSVDYGTDPVFELDITTEDSIYFPLENLIKVSRATLKDISTVSEDTYEVATMSFEVLKASEDITLDFFNDPSSAIERPNANAMIDQVLTNVIDMEGLEPLVIGKKSASSTTNSNTNKNVSILGSQNQPSQNLNTNSVTNLNTNSTQSNVNTNSTTAAQVNLNTNTSSGNLNTNTSTISIGSTTDAQGFATLSDPSTSLFASAPGTTMTSEAGSYITGESMATISSEDAAKESLKKVTKTPDNGPEDALILLGIISLCTSGMLYMYRRRLV